MRPHLILLLFPLFLILHLASCSSQNVPGDWRPEEVKNRTVIVLIPGLYGSALAEEETGERIFLTTGQALWGGKSLALNEPNLEIAGALSLRPDGLLANVPIIPGIYAADAYGKSLEYLESQFGKEARVIPFSYDWRKDNGLTLKQLDQLVVGLKQAQAQRIVLVGHSLGGFLTSLYLRYGAQDFASAKENWGGVTHVDAAIIAAAPFRGCITVFSDFLSGTSVGLSKKPLSPTAVGTFPTFFQFLPPPETGSYLTPGGNKLSDEIYDVKRWKDWRAGLFYEVAGISERGVQSRREYTQKNLSRSRQLANLIDAPTTTPPARKIPVLFITGIGTRTLAKAVLQEKPTRWLFEGKDSTEDGDGLVTENSAKPPAAFISQLNATHLTVSLPHRGMLATASLQEKVTQFLTPIIR